MDRNDRTAIETLFGRLDEVERQAPPRDGEAEAFIHERLRHQQGAPYFMAQTIIVQEQALRSAQERIAELVAQSSPSPQSSLPWNRDRAPSRGTSVPRIPTAAGAGSQRGGGGFLAGAAQTAMGVAGGLLLGNALAGIFGSSDAAAADTTQPRTTCRRMKPGSTMMAILEIWNSELFASCILMQRMMRMR